MVVRFRAYLKDGSIYEGPIQGCGGLLGDCGSHLARQTRETHAFGRLKIAIHRAMVGKTVPIYMVDGSFVMYPNWSARDGGPAVTVPIASTHFELAGEGLCDAG